MINCLGEKMIKYIIEQNNKLDFKKQLDVENPFNFDLKQLTPNTKIHLVDYSKINNEIIVKFSTQKSCLTVVKSIINLYPNLIFSLNLDFWKDYQCRSVLFKTALRTISARELISSDNKDNIDLFKNKYSQFLKDNNLGGIDKIELVLQ